MQPLSRASISEEFGKSPGCPTFALSCGMQDQVSLLTTGHSVRTFVAEGGRWVYVAQAQAFTASGD